MSVEVEASAFTVSAGVASCDSVSRATGAVSVRTTKLVVAGGDTSLATSVTVSVTV